LAIELAAARIRSLGPSELLNRLDDRFRLLRGGGRGGLERHQTLRATVAWSYQLLAEDARVLFDRLSVFAGSFDLDAAEAICAGDHFDDAQLTIDDIVDVLGDLVDKSMVNAVRTRRGMRYRLLETLRQYGEERLDDRGETALVRDAHLSHFVTVARRLGQRSGSADQVDAGHRFDDDWENLGAAHGWAITTGDIAQAHILFGATGNFAVGQVRRDHQQWGVRTLELADTTGQHDAMTYFIQGNWAYTDGDADQAVALGELAAAMDTPAAATLGRTVALFGHMAAGRTDTATRIANELRSTLPDINDPGERYWARLAILNAYRPDTLASDVDAALAAARTIGSPSAVALVLRNAAGRWFVADPPDFDRGFADLNEAIRLSKSAGDSLQWEWMFLTMGRTLADDAAALDTLRQTVHVLHDQRQWAALDATLEAAPALLARHDPVVAATIYGYLEQSPPPVGQLGAGVRALATGHVKAIADNETHRARGAAMGRHDIVALALATLTDN
jgi:hypothetical protein